MGRERFTREQIDMVMEKQSELRELAERIGAERIMMDTGANGESSMISFNDGDTLMVTVSNDGDRVSQSYIRKKA